MKFFRELLLDNRNIKLSDIWGYFDGEPYVFLATVEDDQPRVRPVTLIHLKGKLFVTTGSKDAKVRQIRQNSKTEFCLLLEKDERKGTLRAECIAQIIEDKDIKTDVFNNISFAKEFWNSSNDPTYTVIKLKPISFEYMKPETIEAVKIRI
ncbi:MAG: pyridoxamine 5'-phosphate oxidase family protein [Candidatus Bathyarchaeota archaeon]|jgi:general stress protein 26